MLFINNIADLSQAIRNERKARGLTQAQLAERAGVRRETVIKLERGGNVDLLTLISVINGIGKSLSITQRQRPQYEELRELFNDE